MLHGQSVVTGTTTRSAIIAFPPVAGHGKGALAAYLCARAADWRGLVDEMGEGHLHVRALGLEAFLQFVKNCGKAAQRDLVFVF